MNEPTKNKPTLIVMVGLPRSGKTTWAQLQQWPIVSADAIRLALHGQRFAERAESMVWVIADVMVRALFLAGHDTVIMDGTHTTRKRRDRWKSDEWMTRFQHIPTEAHVCKARAMLEKDDAIQPVIDRMAAQFEKLEEGELPW